MATNNGVSAGERTGYIMMQKVLLLTCFCLLVQCSCARFPEGSPGRGAEAPRLDKSVKFIAGPDKKWFTDDDPVYHYHAYRYGADGRKLLTICHGAGDYGEVCTDDDVQFYLAHSYDMGGMVSSETFHNSAGPDGVWFNDNDPVGWEQVFEYEGDRKKQYLRKKNGETIRLMTYEYDGENIVKDAEYNAPGPDGVWCTDDDVLERYHRFTFDEHGRKIKSREYHAHHRGSGDDGEWFTEDDIVSSAMTHLYHHGRAARDIKLIGAGADCKWFTDDDVLQYYVVHDYSCAVE